MTAATRLLAGNVSVASFSLPRRAVLCFALALCAFGVESIAWPLAQGRDAGTYLIYWVDMFSSRPVYPQLMLFRTPLAPIAMGGLLQLGGSALAEVMLGLAFAASVTAYAAVAAEFRQGAGDGAAIALIIFPSYGALFHTVGSDSIFAFVLALWTLALMRTVRRPTNLRFALLGVGVTLLVLARPAALMLVPVAAFPMVLALPWHRRLAGAAVFGAAIAASLVAWAGYNEFRYSDFVISRTANAHFPLYRLFVADKLVSPDNGPSSEKLAAAVQRDLLTRQPYRAYGITLQQFFTSGSSRMWGDLVSLSDREWGWQSDYSLLRNVALEAIRRHPRAYAADVLTTVRQELSFPWVPDLPVTSAPRAGPQAPPEMIVVHGRRLSKPTEGEPIPASNLWWLASTPDGDIVTDFASLSKPIVVFRDPRDAAHSRSVGREVQRLEADLPNRNGSAFVARWLGRWTRLFPRSWMWLLVGLIALAIRRPARSLVLVVLALIALAIVVGSALGEPAVLEYRVPVDPLFVVFAFGAVLGVRAAGDGPEREANGQAEPIERSQ